MKVRSLLLDFRCWLLGQRVGRREMGVGEMGREGGRESSLAQRIVCSVVMSNCMGGEWKKAMAEEVAGNAQGAQPRPFREVRLFTRPRCQPNSNPG